MIFSKEISEAVAKAHGYGLSFALFMMPNESSIHFFASISGKRLNESTFDSFNGFVFNFFNLSDKIDAIGISPDMTATDVLRFDERKCASSTDANGNVVTESTDKRKYIAGLNKLVSEFAGDEEKTVISRILKTDSTLSPIEVADIYFSLHGDCFRYLYFTPVSGMWIGATPELLLKYNSDSSTLKTMSLAGTKNDSDNNWDLKNQIEHDLVTKHITDVLSRHGCAVAVSGATDVKFGHITHLCHEIEAHGAVRLSKLLPCLSPTPALCGWPREKAYRQIMAYESHSRGCYGGFVGIKDSGDISLYVNLRCASVVKNNKTHAMYENSMYTYTLYAGGGITARSNPEHEWLEAQSKMKSLYSIINQSNH